MDEPEEPEEPEDLDEDPEWSVDDPEEPEEIEDPEEKNMNQDYKVSKQEKDFLDDFAVPAGSGTSQPITFDNNMNAAGIMDNINEMYSDFALSF